MADTLKSKRKREYSQSAMESALICVRDGGLSYRAAGRKNGVPPQTLWRYCMDLSKKQMGTSTKFGKEEEKAIAEILNHLESSFVSAMRDKVKAKEVVAQERKTVSQAKRVAAEERKRTLQAKKKATEKKKVALEEKKAAVVKTKAAAMKAKKAVAAEAKASKPKVSRAKKSPGEPKALKKNKNNGKKS